MNYYHKIRDIFFNELNEQLPDVRAIASWYLNDNTKYQSFDFSKNPKAKHLYKLIRSLELGEGELKTKDGVCNILLRAYNRRLHHPDLPRSYVVSYIPVERYGVGAFINLLNDKGELIDVIITEKKCSDTDAMFDYFRLKLGLEYYLLGIDSDYGYVLHCSTQTATRMFKVEDVVPNDKCGEIIASYKECHGAQDAGVSYTDIVTCEATRALDKKGISLEKVSL